jgi:hypothetical protein
MRCTDYPGNDPSVIQVHVTSAKKDINGSCHVTGEITNKGNGTLTAVHSSQRVRTRFCNSLGKLLAKSEM